LPAGEVLSAIAEDGGSAIRYVSANVGLIAFEAGLTPRYRVVEAGGRRVGITAVLGDRFQREINNSEVQLMPAEKGLDFMKMPLENLAKYQVYMETNRGVMHIALWPDIAPNTVRNFLDLCYTGYYDNVTFHRVIPGFMIQGGDKSGTGSGKGPRTVNAEFSDRKHEPGVLSMARNATDPNSATSQFFIMHGAAPTLDGVYTAFGKLISGLDVVDKIVNAKTIAQDKPLDPQVIVHATVIRTK